MANRPIITTALQSMYIVLDNSSNASADSIRVSVLDFFNSPEIDALIESASDVSDYLPLAGGIMTGTLVLDADPVNPLEAATMQYVDAEIASAVGDYLPLAGGTMLGDIEMGVNNITWGTTGLIAFDANGAIGITSDNNTYLEGWLYIDSTQAVLGFGNDSITVAEDEINCVIDGNTVFHAIPLQNTFGNGGAGMTFLTALNYTFTNIPNYADDAAADADATLESKAIYTTTAGGRAVYRKP